MAALTEDPAVAAILAELPEDFPLWKVIAPDGEGVDTLSAAQVNRRYTELGGKYGAVSARCQRRWWRWPSAGAWRTRRTLTADIARHRSTPIPASGGGRASR